MNEEIANVTGAAVAGTGDDPVHWRDKEKKPLRVILSRLGNQGSLFPNSKKKIGLGLPNENYKRVDIEKALAKAKEKRLHG
jgi:hypothetical protein